MITENLGYRIIPEYIDQDFNLDLKSVLMDEFELESDVNRSFENFRQGGEMFKLAKSSAQRYFPGTVNSVKAIINGERRFVAEGLSVSELRQKDWNWLFRMTEKVGDADAMKFVWSKAPEGDFKSSWIVRERLAIALLYRASDLIDLGKKESAFQHAKEAMDHVNKLEREGDKSARIDKVWANNYLFRANIFKEMNMDEYADEVMQKAIFHLEEGFYKDFDTNTGLKLVRTKLKYGIEHSNKDEIEDALRIAKVTEICANRDGGIWSNNTNVLLNLLESAILNGKNFEYITTVFKKLDKLSVDVDDIKTIKKLKEISRIFKSLGGLYPEYQIWVESVVVLSDTLINHRPALYEKPSKSKEELNQELYTQTIFDSGIQFKQIYPIWISGNIKGGWILPSTMVSEADREFVRVLLKGWKLNETDDFNHVDATLDEKITHQFDGIKMAKVGNKEQENHKLRMYNLLNLTKARKDGDATTNISVFYELGLGDCREISTSYQYFRDVWWKDRINDHINNALKFRDDPQKFEESLKSAKKLLKKQSILLNFSGISNIKMNNGIPVIDPNTGFFIITEEDGEVEKHTMPVDLILDDDLRIKKLFFNDPLGRAHRLDGNEQEQESEGYSAYQIYKGLLEVGILDVVDENTKAKSKTPIYYFLDNEVNKNLKVFPEMTDYGDRYFMGIPVSGIK